jgi:hypothetical protein
MSDIGDRRSKGTLPALIERAGGTATALAAVVALITAVVTGGYKLYSALEPRESAPKVLKADLRLTNQIPMTLGEYLAAVRRKPKPYKQKLGAEGEFLYLGLEIQGAATRHVSLQWSLFKADESGAAVAPVREYHLQPLDDQLVAGITPDADDYRGIAKAWVPHPTGDGNYLARLELANDRNTLAFVDTHPFLVAANFEAPPVPITVPAVVQAIDE